MDWNNATAIGYLKRAIKDFNMIAKDNGYRELEEDEISRLIISMYYAFDVLTLEEAHKLA